MRIMVITDYAFSIVRNWMTGGFLPSPGSVPSGCLAGTGSAATSFADTALGSPLYPTWHAFDSKSGIGFTCEFEHTVLSGDITTGSLVHEVGMAATSGGTLWFRELLPEIEIFGSTILLSNITLAVK